MGQTEQEAVLAVSFAIAVLAGVRLRSVALAEGHARFGPEDPCLVGYIADGWPRAVQAAIVYLRALGLLRAGAQPFEWHPAKTLDDAELRSVMAAYGDPAPGSDLLPVAVYHALADEPMSLYLPSDSRVAAELQALRTRAISAGALPDAARLRQARGSAWPSAAVFALGLLSILGSRLGDAPASSVSNVVTVGALLAAIILYLSASEEKASPAARTLLGELARRFDVPAVSPELGAPLREQALTAAGALAVLGGGFETWAAALFDQPELGRLATCPDLPATPLPSTPG